jgi:hypothetical protein
LQGLELERRFRTTLGVKFLMFDKDDITKNLKIAGKKMDPRGFYLVNSLYIASAQAYIMARKHFKI